MWSEVGEKYGEHILVGETREFRNHRREIATENEPIHQYDYCCNRVTCLAGDFAVMRLT